MAVRAAYLNIRADDGDATDRAQLLLGKGVEISIKKALWRAMHANRTMFGKKISNLKSFFASIDEDGSGTTGDLLSLPCDQTLVHAAQSAAAQLEKSNGLPFWPGRDGPPVVHSGVVGSSDRWTQHRASIEALHHEHQTLCEEMECQVCARVCLAHTSSTELSLRLNYRRV